MIPFPYGPASLLVALAAAAGYVRLGAWRRATERRGARVMLAAVICGAPLLTSGPGAIQLTVGLLAGYLAIRAVALGAAARAASGGALAALLGVADLLRPVRPDVERPSVGRRLGLGVLGIAACAGLLVVGDAVRLWRWSRALDDLLVCLEVAVGAMGLNNLILAAAGGCTIAGLQDRPALSASLGELWAVRWNHLVAPNLDRGFFRPLARRRRPALGVMAAFTASGVMHVVPVLAAAPLALSLRPALTVMGFFLLHGALVLAERALGWQRAPSTPPALLRARVRTVTLFVLLTPLMLGPFADVTHVHGRGLNQNFSERPKVP